MAVNYLQAVETLAPDDSGYSMRGGRARMKYYIAPSDLDAALIDLLGSAQRGKDGRIVRGMPKAHPRYPDWLMCGSIDQVQGVGIGVATEADIPIQDNNENIVPAFADYTTYGLTASFAQVPYAICSDDKIAVLNGSYYDEDNELQTYKYAEEYLRFTQWIPEPADATITAKQGQSVLRTSDATLPNDVTYSAMPKIYTNISTLKCNWFQVPYHYVTSTNSYLVKLMGTINQNPVSFRQGITWGAGQLLYLGFTATPYCPPNPVFEQIGPAVNAPLLLCDIQMTFQVANRFQSNVPTPTNKNWVAAGHNLLPWLQTRQFYYGTVVPAKPNTDNPDFWVPTWLSSPLELLWTDPDVS